jgi:hypothetical protein
MPVPLSPTATRWNIWSPRRCAAGTAGVGGEAEDEDDIEGGDAATGAGGDVVGVGAAATGVGAVVTGAGAVVTGAAAIGAAVIGRVTQLHLVMLYALAERAQLVLVMVSASPRTLFPKPHGMADPPPHDEAHRIARRLVSELASQFPDEYILSAQARRRGASDT